MNAVSTGEQVAFWLLGSLAVIGALGMVLARNAVHSALWLVVTMLCLGFFYVINAAPFKLDVRKLKALGLTRSFAVGYEISPRGSSYLGKTKRRA